MAEFLVELYVSRHDRGAVEERAARARQAAEQVSRDGAPVRLLRTMFVHEEDTCFYLYDAACADDLREAARRAGLPFEHVTEAITATKGERMASGQQPVGGSRSTPSRWSSGSHRPASRCGRRRWTSASAAV